MALSVIELFHALEDAMQGMTAEEMDRPVGCFVPDDPQGHSVVIEGYNTREEIFWLRAVRED